MEKFIIISSIIFNILLLIFLIVERLRRIKTEYRLDYITDEYNSHIKKHNEECYIWMEYAIEYSKYEIHTDFKHSTIPYRGGLLIPRYIINNIESKIEQSNIH